MGVVPKQYTHMCHGEDLGVVNCTFFGMAINPLIENVCSHSAWIIFHGYLKVTLSGQHINIGWWFGTFFIFPLIGNNHPN